MRVTVALFAGLRELAGARSVEVELPAEPTVADLREAVATSTPIGSLALTGCVVAVDREYAREDVVVSEGSELALVPPVSGGAPVPGGAEPGAPLPPVRRIAVVDRPLDLQALADAVRDPRAGAVVLFEGVTREVSHLDYEAYATMAAEILRAIAEEEVARHGLTAAAVEHRVGRVALGESSVVVAASAPHRGEAFAGARAILDALKARAPIFKHEEGRWVEGALPAPAELP